MNEQFLFSSLKCIDNHTADLGIDKGQNLSHAIPQHPHGISRVGKTLFVSFPFNISIQLLVPFLKFCKGCIFPVPLRQYQFYKSRCSPEILPCGPFHFRVRRNLVDTFHCQIHALF